MEFYLQHANHFLHQSWNEHVVLLQNLNVYQVVLDVLLFVFSVYVLFRKQYKPSKPLTRKEMEQLIQEWQPEPMHPTLTPLQALNSKVPTIESSNVTHSVVNGKQVLNLARSNFLGMITNKRVEEESIKSLQKYGCGTCGPRGFYGTIDVHLECEKRIKNFVGHEDGIMYSLGFATISSVIPAFAARGDLLIVDKGVHFAVQTGVKLSRAEVKWFEHNNMESLENVLKSIQEEDKKGLRQLTRRWIVLEGLYYNYGDILPLPKIMELKKKYCYRLIVDEAYSLGVLGKTGRGVCEHYNIKPTEVEILTGNFAGATGSVGGYCLSDKNIIYHQRLNASGYVYSASLPPLLTQAAITAIDILDENPKLVSNLVENSEFFYRELSTIKDIVITSSPRSPVVHFRLKEESADRLETEMTLQRIVDSALEDGVLICRATYTPESMFVPPPSIRVNVSAVHTKEQLLQVKKAIANAVEQLAKDTPKTPKKEAKAKKDRETLAEAEKFLHRAGETPKRDSRRKSTIPSSSDQ